MRGRAVAAACRDPPWLKVQLRMAARPGPSPGPKLTWCRVRVRVGVGVGVGVGLPLERGLRRGVGIRYAVWR